MPTWTVQLDNGEEIDILADSIDVSPSGVLLFVGLSPSPSRTLAALNARAWLAVRYKGMFGDTADKSIRKL